jgi:hypothetical protein
VILPVHTGVKYWPRVALEKLLRVHVGKRGRKHLFPTLNRSRAQRVIENEKEQQQWTLIILPENPTVQ